MSVLLSSEVSSVADSIRELRSEQCNRMKMCQPVSSIDLALLYRALVILCPSKLTKLVSRYIESGVPIDTCHDATFRLCCDKITNGRITEKDNDVIWSITNFSMEGFLCAVSGKHRRKWLTRSRAERML